MRTFAFGWTRFRRLLVAVGAVLVLAGSGPTLAANPFYAYIGLSDGPRCVAAGGGVPLSYMVSGGNDVVRIDWTATAGSFTKLGEPWTTFIMPSVPATIQLTLTNQWGAKASAQLQVWPADLQPPTTQIQASGPQTYIEKPGGNRGWYQGDVRLTLTASHVCSRSTQSFYSLDGGAEVPYSGPVYVSGDGHHLFRYRTMDSLGNFDSWKELPLKIDSTPPSASIAILPILGGGTIDPWTVGSVWSAADETSGIVYVEIQDQSYSHYSSWTGSWTWWVERCPHHFASVTEAAGECRHYVPLLDQQKCVRIQVRDESGWVTTVGPGQPSKPGEPRLNEPLCYSTLLGMSGV